MSVLKTLAPTITTLLGGPLAGLAVEAVGAALGWDDTTKEKIETAINSGTMTSEDLAKLKQAELAVQVRLKELGVKIEELEVQDRQSARDRETKTGGITTPTLAWIVIGAFVGMVYGVLFGDVKVDSVLAGTLIGYLSAKAEQVLSYYFGSSRGSDDKTSVIAQLQAALSKKG